SGEHLVLTLDLTAEGDAADLEERELLDGDLPNSVNYAWSDGWSSASGATREFLGVRLVDLAGDQVASTAVDAEGETVGLTADTSEITDSGPQTLAGTVQIAFADPGSDALAVYLPKAPLGPDVPVLAADVLAAVHAPPLAPMVLTPPALAPPLRGPRAAEPTTVAISSDVLFDSSSAELDEEAKGALDEAARRIESHEPGPVTIIGHTDSVD